MKQEIPTIQGPRPLKAIRRLCLECSGGVKAVRECPSVNCPVHPFRLGTDPFRKKRKLSYQDKRNLLKRLSQSGSV